MSQNYFHSRWNDERWKDDGYSGLKLTDWIYLDGERIGDARITYWRYEEPHATGDIEIPIDLHFGQYHMRADYGRSFQWIWGKGCIPKMKSFIERFIAENYPTICRWYYGDVYSTFLSNTDKYDRHFIKDLREEDIKAAQEHIERIYQAVVAVEKGTAPGPAPVKRSGQLTLSAEA